MEGTSLFSLSDMTGAERGEGGGRDAADPRMEFGVEMGLGGGEACRRRLVRSEAKKASRPDMGRQFMSSRALCSCSKE